MMSVCVAALAAVCTQAALAQGNPDARAPVTDELTKQPNVLLLVGDDMGLGELSPFGSEINTPALSLLADKGTRFSNFHVSPVCSVTRSQLLTGASSRQIGKEWANAATGALQWWKWLSVKAVSGFP